MLEVSPTTVLLLVCILSFAFYRWIFDKRRKRIPKGPWGFPIVGHLPLFGDSPPDVFLKWREKYGDIYRIRLGSWNTIVLNGYDVVKEAAELPEDAFSGRPGFVTTKVLAERNGEESLAFGNFSLVYLKQRKLAASALRLFTTKRRDELSALVQEETKMCVQTLLSRKINMAGLITFDIQKMVGRIQYQFLYGRDQSIDIDKHVNHIRDNLHNFNEFAGRGNPLDVMPWLQYVMPSRIRLFKELISNSDDIMNYQLTKHVNTFTQGHIRDVTDALLANHSDDESNENKYALSRNRLTMTLADFQGAAYDTTQTSVLWLLAYMTAFPEVQKKVHLEIDAIKSRTDSVELTDRQRLVYTDAVIHEVFRCASVIPFSLPHYAVKDTRLREFDIETGTVVLFNLHSIHYDKEFWGDPDVFRPERFITDRNTLDDEKCKHVVAFSLGRRRCVGEALAKINVFLIFTTIMQGCQLIKPADAQIDLRPEQGLVYFPKNFKVVVSARE